MTDATTETNEGSQLTALDTIRELAAALAREPGVDDGKWQLLDRARMPFGADFFGWPRVAAARIARVSRRVSTCRQTV
jgi:hypothetical protein